MMPLSKKRNKILRVNDRQFVVESSYPGLPYTMFLTKFRFLRFKIYKGINCHYSRIFPLRKRTFIVQKYFLKTETVSGNVNLLSLISLKKNCSF